MKSKLLMFLAISCLFVGTSEGASNLMNESDTFRCSNKLVSRGDLFQEVKEKCGEPTSFGGSEWVYDFGPYSFIYVLKFRNSRVYKIINTGNYGIKQSK